MNDRELYMEAKKASEKAYAPYSGFRVGAAVLTAGGDVYTGCNIENSSFGAGICAERTAMAKAVSEGAERFTRIAVASSGGAAWPCGICRQFMFEFCDRADVFMIITGDDEDHLVSMSLEQALPEGFRL